MQQFTKKPTKTESLGRFKSEITDSIETVHQAPTRQSCKTVLYYFAQVVFSLLWSYSKNPPHGAGLSRQLCPY